MKYGLLIIWAVLISCTDEHLNMNQVSLEGKWVDINTTTDTLSFEIFGDRDSMVLERGKETRDGFLLPKYGSGPYEYKLISGEKISLRWSLSSSSFFNDYYFKQEGNTLTVEEFFDTATPGKLLTFKKIN
ncbi:MAG: hypothetical protein OEW75_11470 [Cyclobacteriaceae bacterium]|nr:hypothetical protein [Cyclobacteriaceae bacterium]